MAANCPATEINCLLVQSHCRVRDNRPSRDWIFGRMTGPMFIYGIATFLGESGNLDRLSRNLKTVGEEAKVWGGGKVTGIALSSWLFC